MSTATAVPAEKLKPMQLIVFGRIESVRKYEDSFYTAVICPAKDKYTQPSIVEITSKTRLGNKEDEITQLCQIGGYRRKPFQVTDKDTGELITVRAVGLTLEAI